MGLKDDVLQKGWLLEFPAELRKERVSGMLSQSFGDLFYAEKDRAGVWQFREAYRAVEDLATAALIAAGYGVFTERHHYILQTLAFTIHARADLIDRLEMLRTQYERLRHEPDMAVSEQDAKEMMALARELNTTVRAWVRSAHPELITEFT